MFILEIWIDSHNMIVSYLHVFWSNEPIMFLVTEESASVEWLELHLHRSCFGSTFVASVVTKTCSLR